MNRIEVIRREIVALQDEINHDPRVKVLDHLKQALALLVGNSVLNEVVVQKEGSTQDKAPAEVAPQTTLPVGHAAVPFKFPVREPKIKRLYDVIGSYIDTHGPTHRKKLYEVLVDAGVMRADIPNPLSVLSSSMNTLCKHFASDGHGVFARNPNAPAELSPVWSKRPSVEPEGSEGRKNEAAQRSLASGF